jgi:hypothetical protein
MSKKNISDIYLEREEKQTLETAIKVVDEAIGKLQWCRDLLKDGKIPIVLSDIGFKEVTTLCCLITAISRIRGIIHYSDKHKETHKYQNNF